VHVSFHSHNVQSGHYAGLATLFSSVKIFDLIQIIFGDLQYLDELKVTQSYFLSDIGTQKPYWRGY